MKINNRLILLIVFTSFINTMMFGYYKVDKNKPSNGQLNTREGDCAEAEAQIDLAINNVRARLLTGGDMWWDLNVGKYIVPNVAIGEPEVSSLFASSVWLGGYDGGGGLHVAAVTYRSTGTDYYPGILDSAGNVSDVACKNWDRFFVVKGAEIDKHKSDFNAAQEGGPAYEEEDVPESLRRWPGFGNPDFEDLWGFSLPDDTLTMTNGIAPFFDYNLNGIYDPVNGDFPIIEIRCYVDDFENSVYADELIYWIYNDNGGAHTFSHEAAMKMEVQVEAFAWVTADELNDMTFYRYKLINKNDTPLRNTYFGVWVDPDLGCSEDDYIGCVVDKSLAYVYNFDAEDGSSGCDCPSPGGGSTNTYCTDIPMIGIDYFRGPLGPRNFDTLGLPTIIPPLGEDGDTIIELGMSSFVYFNRESPNPATTDPSNGQEVYNLLAGLWKDGTPFTFGGDGYNPGSTDTVSYVFPDEPSDVNGWSMVSENLTPGDRRTVQATGPFNLDIGAKNELIIGLPWVPNIPHPVPSIKALLTADELAQGLFDNCFKIIDGPDAPDAEFHGLDQKIIASLSNKKGVSNNFVVNDLDYEEKDIVEYPDGVDDTYNFEGYIVYQTIDGNVTASDLSDPSVSRVVFQCDVKNDIVDLYNWEAVLDPVTQSNVYVPVLAVEAANKGVVNSFELTTDAFNTGSNNKLVNHKKYYYTVVAYGYNQYERFDPVLKYGQKRPCLFGRKINSYIVIPHIPVETALNSNFGDGPVIYRLEGEGVGDNNVALSEKTIGEILDGDNNGELEYKKGQGPIDVEITNPYNIENGEYIIRFVNSTPDDVSIDPNATKWILEKDGNVVDTSDFTIGYSHQKLFSDRGFGVRLYNSYEPGAFLTSPTGDRTPLLENDGALGISVEYKDPKGSEWANFVNPQSLGFSYIKKKNELDPCVIGDDLYTMNDGMFVPYTFTKCSFETNEFNVSPADESTGLCVVNTCNTDRLNNVDIVFTSDKSKWSKCVVVETAAKELYNNAPLPIPTEGGTSIKKFRLRAHASVSKDAIAGNPDAAALANDGTEGYGWFPGYVIDVSTGKRLNVFFGENSAFSPENNSDENLPFNGDLPTNGSDMVFNPGSAQYLPYNSGAALYGGGQHFIYITNEEYDGCEVIHTYLAQTASSSKVNKVIKKTTWTGLPLVTGGLELLSYADGLIPNDMTVRIRVTDPYKTHIATDYDDKGLPVYKFKFEGQESTLPDENLANDYLDQINVVPNPYYGFSDYETGKISTKVKITNLPPKCTVTIYSLDGKFIRQYKKDDISRIDNRDFDSLFNNDIEWDIKNQKGVPIASGVYLIHISSPQGERTIKWFGALRKFDPSGL